jgi:TPR repeat protein
VLARGHDLGPPDPAAAVHWFELAAAEGSVPAMFLLANAYRDGAGIAHDDERARYWYQAAGEHGDAEALQTLALAYRFGELSLAVDEDEARRYELEAEHALDHAR